MGSTTGSTTTSGPGSTTTTAPALSPDQVNVQVLNGSNPSEPLASQTAAGLRRQGFSISAVDNAPSTVATTEIEYAEGQADAGQAVADRVEGKTVQAADPQLQGDQVILVVGKSFGGVKSATSTSSVSTTSSPSTGSKLGRFDRQHDSGRLDSVRHHHHHDAPRQGAGEHPAGALEPDPLHPAWLRGPPG